jgi:hypothetical protein
LSTTGGGSSGTSLVQYMQRLAPTGIMLVHSGHARSVATSFRVARAVSLAVGATMSQ